MTRYTRFAVDEKWGDVVVNYGTDRALGYWYDVMRSTPKLEMDKTIVGIDIDTGFGYMNPAPIGIIRSIKIFEGDNWYDRGEKALFELDGSFPMWISDDDPNEGYSPEYHPAGNHIWLAHNEIWEDNPIADKSTTFDGLTRVGLVETLAKYGIVSDNFQNI